MSENRIFLLRELYTRLLNWQGEENDLSFVKLEALEEEGTGEAHVFKEMGSKNLCFWWHRLANWLGLR